MTRALITGGSGFIGLTLGTYLVERGWHVDLLDNFSRGANDSEFRAFINRPEVGLFELDLTIGHAVESLPTHYDYLFHFAAIVGVENVNRQPAKVLRANVDLLTTALQLAHMQTQLKRFVFASTSEVYAGTLEHFGLPIPTPEDTPLTITDLSRPRTSYMLSKIYGEAICQASGIPVTIIRPHNFYGPRMGMAHVIPQLLQRAYSLPQESAFEVNSVDHSRTFCFIADAVEMIYRIALSDEGAGKVVNIGTQEPEITIGELAQMILTLLGRHAEISPLPPADGSPNRRAPDMSVCRAVTGYESVVTIEEGLRKTFEWYESNGFLGDQN